MWSLCLAAVPLFRRLEPLIFLQQLGSALFDTALQMVVKDRCANATSTEHQNLSSSSSSSTENSRQKAMTDFYMTYNLILKLAPILPALLLARLGDRGWRRAPIISPLLGFLLSRLTLLLVVLLHWPLEVMFAGAALYGLFGGFCSYWAGVMTLASLISTPEDRSKVMMRVELVYGAGGILGSLVSGHLFLLYTPSLGQGTILLIVSTLLFVLCLIHSTVLLQVKEVPSEEPEGNPLIPPISDEVPVDAPAKKNMVNVVLLFVAAIFYDVAVGGAMEILVSFVMKEPLNWDATQVGYGNAAGCTIFFTSFLGVMLMSRWFSDVSLILIGMVSFASGIYFMSFVTATYMFYLARSLTLFGLIPVPTIRSLLSQQVQGNSYGITLTSLQIALKFAGSAYIPAYTKIYQSTLDWFPGFVFTLSGIITALGMIPICIVGCRSAQKRRHERIQGD